MPRVPTPTFTTILTDIKAALLEIEQTVYNVPAVPFGHWQTQELPRWTNNVRSIADGDSYGSDTISSVLTIQVMLVLEYLTAGVQTATVNEYEEAAQRYLGEIRAAFKAHNHLQTTSYPQGVNGIAPEGITVASGEKGLYKAEPFGPVYTILTTLTIPIVQDYTTES